MTTVLRFFHDGSLTGVRTTVRHDGSSALVTPVRHDGSSALVTTVLPRPSQQVFTSALRHGSAALVTSVIRHWSRRGFSARHDAFFIGAPQRRVPSALHGGSSQSVLTDGSLPFVDGGCHGVRYRFMVEL
jgi:hypothetical protein